MDYFIPEELKPAARLVRECRKHIPPEYERRSRMIVKIRNTALFFALGLMLWLPALIVGGTHGRLLSMIFSYLGLCALIASILWYVLHRTRHHAVDILDLVAEEHPDMTMQLAGLMSLPWYLLIFGPWYRIGYAPHFIEKRLRKLAEAFTLPK